MSSLSNSGNTIDRRVLDAALGRVATSSLREQFVLRGSYLTSHWVGAENRSCADLDFLALGEFDQANVRNQFANLLSTPSEDLIQFITDQLTCDVIFEDTDFPGCRLTVPALLEEKTYELQIDVGFRDPLSEPPTLETIPSTIGDISIQCISPEIAFAWKLHGLVEKQGLSWRPKDLADLWLIQNRFKLDADKLDAAIKVAFESRDAPFWRLDRLINETLGQTSGSRKRYARFLQINGKGDLPGDLKTVVTKVAALARASLERLTPEPSGPFDPPVEFLAKELIQATGLDSSDGKSVYRKYAWNDGTTVVQERAELRISPHLAETKSKNRLVLLQRESRGITFDAQGKIIARPYAAFEPRLGIDNIKSIGKLLTQEQFESCEVLEKLDGSLIFPTPDETSNSGWRLRTRRGRSSIADDAFEFTRHRDESGATNYRGLIESCLSNNQTPIFEWCSRKRIIVLDHPEDRLVLTGVRDNSTGHLLPHSALQSLSEKFTVELIRKLGRPQTVERLCNWVATLEQAEGVILRSACGRQFKIKSNRYLWLHRAIEGPSRGRACWHLWAIGAKEQLVQLAALREMDLTPAFAELETTVARLEAHINGLLAKAKPEQRGGRKRLAKSLENETNLTSKLAFGLFDGRQFDALIREFIAFRSTSETPFKQMLERLDRLAEANDES